jgi:hypothetical protein
LLIQLQQLNALQSLASGDSVRGPNALEHRKSAVSASGTLKVGMPRAGGFVARLTKSPIGRRQKTAFAMRGTDRAITAILILKRVLHPFPIPRR